MSETLREVCEHLAPIDKTPCSAGEREAAEWIADRLRSAGVGEVAIEDEPSWGTFAPTATWLGVLGVLGAVLVLRGRRVSGAAIGVASMLGVLDEAENGPRVVRRMFRRRRTTANVVGRLGDPNAERTLIVLAHHDAAQTGRIFDQSLHIAIHRRFPGLLRRFKHQPPQWWVAAAAPLGAVLTAISGRRRPATLGAAAGALAVYVAADIWRSPTVPGANDNLSAVAVLVALAEELRERPIPGLRVWLVSAGAEETLQDGVRAFMTTHRAELEPASTRFLVPDAVGSPRLIMLEGEGPFWMHEYTDPSFRDLVERVAAGQGVALERGFHARASTDAVIPSRAGYPTVMLGSLNEWQTISNYHQMTDVPENLDYGTIADAVRLSYAVAVELATPSNASA